jgi:hypothetical protein
MSAPVIIGWVWVFGFGSVWVLSLATIVALYLPVEKGYRAVYRTAQWGFRFAKWAK